MKSITVAELISALSEMPGDTKLDISDVKVKDTAFTPYIQVELPLSMKADR